MSFKLFFLINLILLVGCGQQTMNATKTPKTSSAAALSINNIVGKQYYVVTNGFTCTPFGPTSTVITKNWSDKIAFTLDSNQIAVVIYGGPCNDAFGTVNYDANVFRVSADQQSVIYQGKTFVLKADDSF